MENTALIESVCEIRTTLRSTLREANGLSMKLRGPQPGDGPVEPKRTEESVASVINDIRNLSGTLEKIIADQHSILGGFNPVPAGRTIA